MKHLRHLALCLLLVLTMATSAFAAEVPENLVVENLNGQQRIVKTYVLSPETDPDTLKESPPKWIIMLIKWRKKRPIVY